MTRYRYFNREEFACKCGCGTNNVSDSLIARLDRARHIAGFPLVVTSGVRCPEHNAKSGGVADSAHVSGLAADIACTSSAQRFKLMQALFLAGFDRIGVASSFVHADVDERKPQGVLWTY